MKCLFATLTEHCPFLKSIDLSNTSVTNQSCGYIAGKAGNQVNLRRYNLRKPKAIHVKFYGTKVDQHGVSMLNLKGDSLRIKAYCDYKAEGKRKAQGQRNLRELIHRMRK